MSDAAPAPRASLNVGVIGVGNMGAGMAWRLIQTGWRVHAVDVDPVQLDLCVQAGARRCKSPAQAAQQCEWLIIAVVDAAQIRQVLSGPEGALAHLDARHGVLLCPTISPEDARSCCEAIAATGAQVLDAPMSGGPMRARDGSMSLMLGGPAGAITAAQALLSSLSSKLFHVGKRWGDGARAKLVNNMLAAINLAAAAEATALAERLGLDAGLMQAVIEASSGASWIGTDRIHRALANDFRPRAQVNLLKKDSALALAAAQAIGITPALGQVARDLFAQAAQNGLAELDDAALLLLQRRRFEAQVTAQPQDDTSSTTRS